MGEITLAGEEGVRTGAQLTQVSVWRNPDSKANTGVL